MPITSAGLRVRLFINNDRWGWSEEWPLNQLYFDDAPAIALQIAQARSYLLAENCPMVWASLSTDAPPYCELALLTGPLEPLPQWGPPLERSAVYWNFSSGQGIVQPRILRGLDKTEIVRDRWKRHGMVIPPGPVPEPANVLTASKQDLFQYALAFLRDHTMAMRKAPAAPDGSPQWNLYPWEFVRFASLGSRRAFSNWKRMSWEAEPWENAPAFSVCGMATTVLRRTYTNACRFYTDAEPQTIHFYFAPEDASVFPLKTIFFGWDRVKQIQNGDLCGEITSPSERDFVYGPALGDAPGLSYYGSQADFLGQNTVPWSPQTPTPPDLRPDCDRPSYLLQEDLSFLLQENGDRLILDHP